MKQKYCISVDWFEVSTRCHALTEGKFQNDAFTIGDYCISTRTFIVKRIEGSTSVFEHMYKVVSNRVLVATILQAPRTPVIHPLTTQIKLENRILYSHDWAAILYSLMSAIGASYHNTTRIDVCLDCNYLADGTSPKDFLYQYLTTKEGDSNNLVRVGNSRFAVNGLKSWNGGSEVSYMRWGSPNSKVKAYCYNKSLELLEVKDKPYIRDKWKLNGLIHQTDENAIKSLSEEERKVHEERGTLNQFVKSSVWRFEISITSEMARCVTLDGGSIFRLSPYYFLAQSSIEQVFIDYSQKYLAFRISNGKKNKRFYDEYKLFDFQLEPAMTPKRISSQIDGGRGDIAAANKLEKYYDEFSEVYPVDAQAFKTVRNWLEQIGIRKKVQKKNTIDACKNEDLFARLEQKRREWDEQVYP